MKRLFLTAGLLCFVCISLFAQKKPNVVVFLVDDLRAELGCYGSEAVKSPNIDKLASDGVLFEKAYCQQAICAPSRISLLTGMRPDKLGIYSIFTPLRSVDKQTVTLPQLFKENGYTTISVGKVFHHTNDDIENWTVHFPKEPNSYASSKNIALVDSLRASGHKSVKGPAYECIDVRDEAYKDGRTAKNAIETLRKVKDDNFVMVVGLAKPHLPFNAPKKYWDLYDRKDFNVPLKKNPNGMSKYALTSWNELRGYSGIPQEGELDDELSKTLIHGYNACISYIDAQMGKVLNELEELDLRKNTIVILMSDHGWKLGEYGAWCKHTNFEIDVRVPFIVSMNEDLSTSRNTNVKSNALVENIDMFPTIAELCGIKMHNTDGNSIVPLLRNPKKKWDKSAYSLYGRGNKIMGLTTTDGEWRYTEWRNSSNQEVIDAELYPCHVDFNKQAENLAGLPEYKKIEKRMKEMLSIEYPYSYGSFLYKQRK